MSQSSSRPGGPARSLADAGGSSVSSARNRPRASYPRARSVSCSRSAIRTAAESVRRSRTGPRYARIRSSWPAGVRRVSSAQPARALRSSRIPSAPWRGISTGWSIKLTIGDGPIGSWTPSASIRRRAVAGPMPSGSWSTRNHATSSQGFSSTRSIASASFTCAPSRNRRPPYFTNGMLRRASSTSSTSEWCAARNSTACSRSATPSFTGRDDLAADAVGLSRLVQAGLQHGPRTVGPVGP